MVVLEIVFCPFLLRIVKERAKHFNTTSKNFIEDLSSFRLSLQACTLNLSSFFACEFVETLYGLFLSTFFSGFQSSQ
jgi:hypothetical protein